MRKIWNRWHKSFSGQHFDVREILAIVCGYFVLWLSGNFLKRLWLRRVCCLKPLQTMYGCQLWSSLISISVSINKPKVAYNNDGFRLLLSEVYHNVPAFDAVVRKLIMLCCEAVVTVPILWFISCCILFKRWRKLLFQLCTLFLPFYFLFLFYFLITVCLFSWAFCCH